MVVALVTIASARVCVVVVMMVGCYSKDREAVCQIHKS